MSRWGNDSTDTRRRAGWLPSLIGVKIPQLLRTVAAAVFILGTVPLVIVVDTAAATAQMSANRPHGGVDCVPVGVTTDSKGIVWALEDCNGDIIRYRMSPLR